MSIESAITTRLTSHAGLSALIGARAYADNAPQSPTYPYVVFELEDWDPPRAMGSDNKLVEVAVRVASQNSRVQL